MPRPPAIDLTLAQIVQDVYVEYFQHLAVVPGLEIHSDPDAVWKVSPAAAWNNSGVRLRLVPGTAKKRLDQILVRYNQNARGAGFWVFPSDEPADLEAILASRALRCRKYFPAMFCDLTRPLPSIEAKVPLEFSPVTDYDVFKSVEHPSIGRISTKFRRFQLDACRVLAGCQPRRSWDLMASCRGTPVGMCTLFLGERYAGVFDMGVLERFRNRGIGSALMRHACAFAQERGAEGAILIATNLGYPMYEKVGFREVARVGFWYTAHP